MGQGLDPNLSELKPIKSNNPINTNKEYPPHPILAIRQISIGLIKSINNPKNKTSSLLGGSNKILETLHIKIRMHTRKISIQIKKIKIKKLELDTRITRSI